MSEEQQSVHAGSGSAQPESGIAVSSAQVPESPGRRRFVTGLAGGSVLMTVASQPAMAGLCTPSAWVSGNLSQVGGKHRRCGGKPPKHWRDKPKQWPSRYRPGNCKKDDKGKGKGGGHGGGFGHDDRDCNGKYASNGTPFHRGYGDGSGACRGSSFGDKTMMQLLWEQNNSDLHRLGAHVVAALLNASSIPNYGMSEETIADIWLQVESRGYYKPPHGEAMSVEDVIRFLQNTYE
jgi:hypothetical protein